MGILFTLGRRFPSSAHALLCLINMTIQSPNKEDLSNLVDNYVNHIIDGMDMDCLVQMCYDLLSREYEKLTWDEVTEEIVDLYDEDTLIDLLPQGDS